MLNRDIDRDDALAGGLDDDRIEVERAELSVIRHGKPAELHQQRGQRVDVAPVVGRARR